MANRKLKNLGNLGNLRKIIPSFLISEFSFLLYSQIRKLGFKNLGKKIPRFPRYPRSPNFRLGRFSLTLILSKVSTNRPNSSDIETRKSLRNCSITISFTSSITSRFLLHCCQELFPKTCFICGKYQIQRYDKERKKMYSQKKLLH